MPTLEAADAVAYDRRLAQRYLDDAVASTRTKTRFARGTARHGDRLRVARAVAESTEARMGREARRLVSTAGDDLRPPPAPERAVFARRMRREVAASTLAATRALLPGGTPTPEDRRRMDSEARRQLAYLDGFARAVAAGEVSGPTLIARARLYGAAVWGVAQEVARGRYADDGYTHEMAILAVTEHCPSCIDRAMQGWQPIGTLPRIGDSECRARCQCCWVFRGKSGVSAEV